MDLASEQSVTFTCSKQEKSKDVAGSGESEEYHSGNGKKKRVAAFLLYNTAQSLCYNSI